MPRPFDRESYALAARRVPQERALPADTRSSTKSKVNCNKRNHTVKECQASLARGTRKFKRQPAEKNVAKQKIPSQLSLRRDSHDIPSTARRRHRDFSGQANSPIQLPEQYFAYARQCFGGHASAAYPPKMFPSQAEVRNGGLCLCAQVRLFQQERLPRLHEACTVVPVSLHTDPRRTSV